MPHAQLPNSRDRFDPYGLSGDFLVAGEITMAQKFQKRKLFVSVRAYM